jgi:hypothetical protein
MDDNLNINKILDRVDLGTNILNYLNENPLTKSILVYGKSGVGKTEFVNRLFADHGYDIMSYDSSDVRNKAFIEGFVQNIKGNSNIMGFFNSKMKKTAIIMDDIDCMNSGDKGGINSLLKLIKPNKKTREQITPIIICICLNNMDKKIRELMKYSYSIELKTPTNSQMFEIVRKKTGLSLDIGIISKMNGDLHKIGLAIDIIGSNCDTKCLECLDEQNYGSNEPNRIVHDLFTNNYNINEHARAINESERTIVGLLYHENVVDTLDGSYIDTQDYFYMLEHMSYADNIDRITFQKQIWQFNEMSSILKTFLPNTIYHSKIKNIKPKQDIRFTKVLTKYSTEYNNKMFIQAMCCKMSLDKQDMMTYFDTYYNSDLDEMDGFCVTNADALRVSRYIQHRNEYE